MLLKLMVIFYIMPKFKFWSKWLEKASKCWLAWERYKLENRLYFIGNVQRVGYKKGSWVMKSLPSESLNPVKSLSRHENILFPNTLLNVQFKFKSFVLNGLSLLFQRLFTITLYNYFWRIHTKSVFALVELELKLYLYLVHKIIMTFIKYIKLLLYLYII